MGRGSDRNKVFLIDFGLAKRFMKNGKHIENREDVDSVVGTLRYLSADAQAGKEQGRKDDLESLVMV